MVYADFQQILDKVVLSLVSDGGQRHAFLRTGVLGIWPGEEG